MAGLIVVGISDQKTAGVPDTLITYALGSCVGICLHDPLMRIAGLSHILLPESALCPEDTNRFKFADTAIEALVNTMERKGCSRFRITAKIAGGANMFALIGPNIGQRNVEVVKRELFRLNIKLTAEDTGGNYGRTVDIRPENGIVTIRAIGKAAREL